ncbi:hypothetical protein A2866_02510 [Candidatus Roizmanbacteria bacterium RIFCSPHIGHO2_01_FULL_39_8]|uniref:Cobalt ABC transporter permease n=2 Tax=Candidatus Roizmaniibacteriota TaxID=1752723 RepID=A0A1F7GIM6_9BACT|nr:MAG: hypothetical protein A2866_02510 [Candidatus Roizmanbacteria bacterium RIFCSPHIGHO2_01_FULL_39_8]OGK25645.1 MAG: hypothetical protein A3C28_00550 [Candidatus Roizmanbacteria bacterium RIFCSPHIGHO2_02_FULL_39_9]
MKKLISLIIFSFVILNLKDSFLLSAIFLLLLAALKIVPSQRPVGKRLKILLPAGFFIILLQLFFHQSHDMMTRFMFGYTVFIRLLIVSLSVLFFMSVTSASEIIAAFAFLPKKIQLALTMTFYFIPTILEESDKISMIQKSRGLRSGLSSISSVVIPLLHRVFQRAETLSLTIVSRGYEE